MVDYQRLYEDMPAPRFQVYRAEDASFVLRSPNKKAASFFGDLEVADSEEFRLDALISQDDYMTFSQAYDVCLSTRAAVPVYLQPLAMLPSGMRKSPRPFMVFAVQDRKGKSTGVDVIGNTHIMRHASLKEERDDALMMMSSVFDMSEVGIVVTDEKQRIARVNKSVIRNFGWSEDDLIGQDITGFVTPDVRKAMVGQQNSLISEDGQKGSGELRVIRHDGSIANVLFTAASMELSGGRMFQVFTLMDITLRKRMEETLRASKDRADSASRAKTVFLANMSHELRTPLNAIMGFSEIMREGTFGPLNHPRYEGYVEDIHNSAVHLLDIINEVLDMSKVEAGKIELDETWVEVDEIINDVIRMIESRAFGKGIVFEKDIGQTLPAMYCDRRIIRQIFINLMMNAVKFSNDGGRVIVHAKTLDDGGLSLIVEDDGIGIAEDKIPQVLEPFGQVDDGGEYAAREGTGLGLPLAKAMVELHGGRLDLVSSVGKGTRVILTFSADRVQPKSA